MKRQAARSLTQMIAAVAIAAACTAGDVDGTPGLGGRGGGTGNGSGGSNSSTGGQSGSTPGTGGGVGTGGSLGSGGIAGTGGTPSGTGGAIGSGGRAGTGGGGGSGGMVSSGGTTGSGGIAGTGPAGSGGRGGTTNTGGAAGTGGATGSGGSGATGAAGMQQWIGTWTASPYPVGSNDHPPASLANSVLRQVVHGSIGSSQIRVQLSNLSGNGPVTINSVHVALCKATPLVDSTIDTATDKALAFSGMASVTIAQGKEIWSDPIAFTVAPLGNVSITTAFGSIPSNLTGHADSRTTSYLQTNSSNVTAANMTSAQKTNHWYYISGMEVMADASAKAVVAIGDSITDGYGIDINKNNRWTDVLSARLRANAPTANVALLNQGSGATSLVGTTGTAAQARFNRDVLGQSGVRYVIVYDGVNDIGGGKTFAAMKAAYEDLISRAHAEGLLIYGATILPFGGHSYYTTEHESVRQQVNTYIKSGVFDGIINFDAALTDNGNPPRLQETYVQWSMKDYLHPGPAGHQKMGETADLNLFTK